MQEARSAEDGQPRRPVDLRLLQGSEERARMWIALPSTCCPSAPEEADSTSASAWRAELLERCAMSRSKRSPAKSWLRAWRKVAWMQRLFGRIFDPSTAALGVASWISSLAASRAPTSRTQGSEPDSSKASTPRSGSSSPASFARWDQASFSWRTSHLSLFGGSIEFLETWPPSGSMRNGTCSARPKSARPTFESDSSSWPTPVASEGEHGWPSRTIGSKGDLGLSGLAAKWPTPTKSSSQGNSRRGGDRQGELLIGRLDLKKWPTPCAADSNRRGNFARGNPTLNEMGSRWPTPTANEATGYMSGRDSDVWRPSLKGAVLGLKPNRSGRPDRTTAKAGPASSGKSLALNPRFVEALMGWPIGWTDSGSSETGSSRKTRCSRSSRSQKGSRVE